MELTYTPPKDPKGVQRSLTTEDRRELCSRVDFPALLREDGIEVRPEAGVLKCRLRDEHTPSCVLYPPGKGKRGGDGWTFYDFGSSEGGDVLGYLTEHRGMTFLDAGRFLSERTGYTPACWAHTNNEPNRPAPKPSAPAAPPQEPTKPASMPLLEQTYAAAHFIAGALFGERGWHALEDARAYLSSRGLRSIVSQSAALMLWENSAQDLADLLANRPDGIPESLKRAGLLYVSERGASLPFKGAEKRDDVCLLVCHAPDGLPAYLVGRRMNHTHGQGQKYLNQPTNGGAVTRLPFNLPALYKAAGLLKLAPTEHPLKWGGEHWNPKHKRKLLIVEGPMDALAAAELGWPSLATLQRPQANSPKDTQGAVVRMLTPHLDALEMLDEVLILPDNDPGEKGQEGRAFANGLAAWLKQKGLIARCVSLKDLGIPETFKDLAEYTQAHPQA